jgi:hypothetical protein
MVDSYTDFVVNEITEEGEVVHLSSYDLPEEPYLVHNESEYVDSAPEVVQCGSDSASVLPRSGVCAL